MREAPGAWKSLINAIMEPSGYHTATICGNDNGIYARALLDMGATRVSYINKSQEQLDNARRKFGSRQDVTCVQGDALHTHINGQDHNLVLTRDQLRTVQPSELTDFLAETRRLLAHGGHLIIQDRTPEDCLQPGSQSHIRGFFFERYPRLAQTETTGRYSNSLLMNALRDAGFRTVQKRHLWETTTLYGNIASLAHSLRDNKQQDEILNELNTNEFNDLIYYIQRQLDINIQPIIEQTRWTIWSGVR